MNVNKVFLMGRLTADPERKVSQNGVEVVTFTIAINRRFKKDETDFIDCVAFRKTAEIICTYFKKGAVLIAFGSLQVDNWKDKDGNNRKQTRVVVDDVQFGSVNPKTNPSEAPKEATQRLDTPKDMFDDVKELAEDELPF